MPSSSNSSFWKLPDRAWLAKYWPLLVMIIGALLPMGRVLADPFGALPGTGGDVYKHCWAYWHTLRQVFGGHFPHTYYLNPTAGGVLLDVMFLPALIMAPVTVVAGPVLAANLFVVLNLVAVAGVVYLLCRHLGASRVGSVCAGVIAQTSPFLLGHALASGVHERFTAWLFPLIALALLETRLHGGWRWPLAAMGGLLLAACSCPTYSVFIAVMLFLLLPLVARVPRSRGRSAWPQLRQLIIAYAGMGLALVAAFLLHHWFVMQENFLAGIPTTRVAPSIGVSSSEFNVATPAALLDPFQVRQQKPSRLDDELHNLVYVGWIPFLAMLGGLAVAIRRRARWGVIVLGLAFLFGFLSMGPVFLVGEKQIINPFFYALAYLVPLYGGVPPVWQQAGIFVMLGSVGLALVISALPGRRLQVVGALLLFAAVMVERVWALPVPVVAEISDARVPKIYDKIDGEGPVAEIPRLLPGVTVARCTMYMAQMHHGQPTTVAINLGLTRWDDYPALTRGISNDWKETVYCLKSGGLRWVMVHKRLFTKKAQSKKCVAGLRAAAGEPVAETADHALFDMARIKLPTLKKAVKCP